MQREMQLEFKPERGGGFVLFLEAFMYLYVVRINTFQRAEWRGLTKMNTAYKAILVNYGRRVPRGLLSTILIAIRR